MLQFDTNPHGGHTLLLDDIHIVKGDFVPPEPQPADVMLSYQLADGGNIQLSWPAAASSFVLQRTDDLNGDWADVGDAADLVGDLNVLTLPIEGGNSFFRLMAP